jgi:putative transposase
MCRVLKVHRSGYYAWLKKPLCNRALEDQRLLKLILKSYNASNGVYGSPRIFLDLCDEGETCGLNRIARIMRANKIVALQPRKRPRYKSGFPSNKVDNHLQREFAVESPDQVWVTDITYIRTWQGWLYLATIIDLYSRKVVGWSMQPNMASKLVIDALSMAAVRRKPENEVLIHSDQGSQYGSNAWHKACEAFGFKPSMSRRGNCWDNAVAESFFGSLKKERVRKRIYQTMDEARNDLFDYIEMFYNPRRRHSHLGGVSPEAFERASNSDL